MISSSFQNFCYVANIFMYIMMLQVSLEYLRSNRRLLLPSKIRAVWLNCSSHGQPKTFFFPASFTCKIYQEIWTDLMDDSQSITTEYLFSGTFGIALCFVLINRLGTFSMMIWEYVNQYKWNSNSVLSNVTEKEGSTWNLTVSSVFADTYRFIASH